MNNQRLHIYKTLKTWFSTNKYIDHIFTFEKQILNKMKNDLFLI